MKTILSIQKIDTSERVYQVNSIDELFDAIDKEIAQNTNASQIKLESLENLDKFYLRDALGFDIYQADRKIIKFRGYKVWAYFKNNEPVFFDFACSGINLAPHIVGGRNKIYDTLDFDRFEKITV